MDKTIWVDRVAAMSIANDLSSEPFRKAVLLAMPVTERFLGRAAFKQSDFFVEINLLAQTGQGTDSDWAAFWKAAGRWMPEAIRIAQQCRETQEKTHAQ